ncbi:hypothetical protein ALC60_07356 [Trachymyrmex zeteki]|uniref:DUF4773 domain-containing protein n=1 Tax=Mycetomoellerius zeteki TaxID=64791 RepID=A0A151X0R9_9HYME|nr:hypothetical protein ALC60_07356 [Trachymyrmex zeteki]
MERLRHVEFMDIVFIGILFCTGIAKATGQDEITPIFPLDNETHICVNASYLEKDYGISLTITYNNFVIINETISARNPPPICFGEDILNEVDIEVCLHMYDINIDKHKFHVCFEIYGKIMKLPITKIKLGCIQTKLHDKMEYIENNLSKLFLKGTKNDALPIVTMV